MVIAHVIDSLEVGGAEAVVAALCRLQTAAAHATSVHCLHHKGPIAEALEAEGVPVFLHGPGSSASIVWRLYQEFRRIRPAVVHCHNKSATVHAALAARLAGARVVIATRHGMAALPYRLRKELKFWLVTAMFLDRVVAVCETARRNMTAGARPMAHKVVTVRNGAYPPRATAAGTRLRNGFSLVTVGRLAPAKDYATLLRSVALARQRVADLSLRLVGDGPQATELKRLASELGVSDVVEFCGERADVGTLLRDADLFVLSSVSEGLPISILEAMAEGLPAIVTNVGGMPEVVELSGAGTTVPARDAEQLATAIAGFAERRHDLPRLRERARRCYADHFTPDRMNGDYLALYQACLQEPGRTN